MFARLTNLSLHVSIELAKPECHGPVTTLANQRMLPCDKLSRLRALEMENLPLWFLILSLFLPRVSLIIAYFGDLLSPFNLHGWVPPTIAVLIPRVLVLIMIFQDRGFSPWLVAHGIAMVFVYLAAGSRN